MTHPMSTQPITHHHRAGAGEVDATSQRVAAEQLPEESVEPRHPWYLFCRVVFDFLAALLLLLLSAPVIVLGALLVKLTSRGPAFYCQTRLGKDGRQFTLYKLRTMIKNAEKITGPVWADADDSRITPVGRFLRSAHVDELPQLVNVLLGQMSLVGPRPERPELVPDLEEQLPRYRDRLKVRPGITGFAQLRLPADSDVQSVRQKLVYDLFYVQFANPWLDAQILFFTTIRVFVDVLKTVWQPVALPRWETVVGRVPAVIDSDADWDASEDTLGDVADELPLLGPGAHAELRKAR